MNNKYIVIAALLGLSSAQSTTNLKDFDYSFNTQKEFDIQKQKRQEKLHQKQDRLESDWEKRHDKQTKNHEDDNGHDLQPIEPAYVWMTPEERSAVDHQDQDLEYLDLDAWLDQEIKELEADSKQQTIEIEQEMSHYSNDEADKAYWTQFWDYVLGTQEMQTNSAQLETDQQHLKDIERELFDDKNEKDLVDRMETTEKQLIEKEKEDLKAKHDTRDLEKDVHDPFSPTEVDHLKYENEDLVFKIDDHADFTFPHDTFTDVALGFIKGVTGEQLLKTTFNKCDVKMTPLKHKITYAAKVVKHFKREKNFPSEDDEVDMCRQVLDSIVQEAPTFFLQLGYCPYLGYHTDKLRKFALSHIDQAVMQEKIDEHIEWHRKEIIEDTKKAVEYYDKRDFRHFGYAIGDLVKDVLADDSNTEKK